MIFAAAYETAPRELDELPARPGHATQAGPAHCAHTTGRLA